MEETMQNPYTLTFGKEPIEYIKRIAEERQILEDFLSPNPPASGVYDFRSPWMWKNGVYDRYFPGDRKR